MSSQSMARSCAIFVHGTRKSSHMNTSCSPSGSFESMKNLEMTIRELSINQASEDIQNAGFVGSDSMEMMNCTHITGKITKNVISASEGAMVAIHNTT